MRGAFFGLVLIAGCADHTEITGTYVGTAHGDAPGSFTLPDERIEVRTVDRHYQYSEVEVTVRGCTLRSSGGGETRWTFPSTRCTLALPSGPVTFDASGGVTREPATRAKKATEVHVSIQGTSAGRPISYSITAKPVP